MILSFERHQTGFWRISVLDGLLSSSYGATEIENKSLSRLFILGKPYLKIHQARLFELKMVSYSEVHQKQVDQPKMSYWKFQKGRKHIHKLMLVFIPIKSQRKNEIYWSNNHYWRPKFPEMRLKTELKSLLIQHAHNPC